MTNWDAMQTVKGAKGKNSLPLTDIKTRHLAMGSWRADKSKGGTLRPRKLSTRR